MRRSRLSKPAEFGWYENSTRNAVWDVPGAAEYTGSNICVAGVETGYTVRAINCGNHGGGSGRFMLTMF